MDTRKPFHMPWGWAFCLLAAIAVFFLWEEHRAHILGALPYLLALACPVIHLLMHRNTVVTRTARVSREVCHEPRS